LAALALPSVAAQSLSGRWEGSIQIPDNEVRVVVDLTADKSGVWAGSIIIPGLNIKGLSLKDVAVKGSEVTFGVKAGLGNGLEAAFKGHLNGNGGLTGEFTQGGNTAPFELKQIGPAQVEMPVRSTVVSNDVEGEWHGEYQLLGYARTVTLKLTNKSDHAAAAEFVVVGKRVNNLPVDLVTQEGNLVSVHSHETGITLEGRFRKEANEIRGSFSQGPIEVPLVLHRKAGP
jgi:hypothetical protein